MDSERAATNRIRIVALGAIGVALASLSLVLSRVAALEEQLLETWVDELLDDDDDDRFHKELGMHKHVFLELLETLTKDAGLCDTRNVSAEEQLAMFLHFARRGLSNEDLQERFESDRDTIKECIHHVLDALTSKAFYCAYTRLPRSNSPVPAVIERDNRFFPFFKDCLGAIDGIHVPANVPEERRIPFRNRKGLLSQNVLVASSMDMKFVYVLSGWEGSASDSRVYGDAWARGFRAPKGRYYLADAVYANSDALMVPYRGVRYHLKDWEKARGRPQNYKELFNYRHAKLRNVIVRICEVQKKRFKVLGVAPEFSLTTQTQIVLALAVLHNFISIYDPEDPLFDGEDVIQDDADDPVSGRQQGAIALEGSEQGRLGAAARRDSIAKAMWADYEAKGHRG